MSNLTATEKIKSACTNDDFVIDEIANRAAIEKITLARVAMVMKFPFFGTIAIRMRLVNADRWLPTAATDGRRLYYNSAFVNNLSVREAMFLLAHEVLHVAYLHVGGASGRLGDRNHRVFNIACDYKVNQDLFDCDLGNIANSNNAGALIKVALSMIKSALISPQFKDMTAEEVYDYLMDNANNVDIDDLANKMIDDHLSDDDTSGEEKDGDGGDHSVSSGPIKISAEERERIKDEIKEAVINAAKSASSAGSVPAGIRKMVGDITDPRMPWDELLQQNMLSTIKNDFSWMKVNRKGWHLGAVLPGMNYEEQIDICVAIDNSGSCYKEATKFFSEVHAIAALHPNAFKITVWTFDTKCYNSAVFTENNLDEMLQYEITGGGGTHFEANWEFMKNEAIEPKLLIVFTDGFNDNHSVWGDDTYCDTLWIIYQNDTCIPPFGMHAYYDAE